MSDQPQKRFEDFLAACTAKTNVLVEYDALISARAYFHLDNENAVKDFIANGGIENKRLVNSIPLRVKYTELHIPVDAYKFKTGMMPAYIAFYFQPKKKIWVVKSFKPDRDCDPTIADEMKKALGQK